MSFFFVLFLPLSLLVPSSPGTHLSKNGPQSEFGNGAPDGLVVCFISWGPCARRPAWRLREAHSRPVGRGPPCATQHEAKFCVGFPICILSQGGVGSRVALDVKRWIPRVCPTCPPPAHDRVTPPRTGHHRISDHFLTRWWHPCKGNLY
jgi:hypothetical protein